MSLARHPLPMSLAEAEANFGWREFDVILVTGDAYIDHPSFGVGIIGRWLEHLGVRVGIMEGVAAPPPDSGLLDPADPVRFGRSNMLSFSPLGTATPGTFYLTNERVQAAVRVSPGSGRVRLMVYQGGKWRNQ